MEQTTTPNKMNTMVIDDGSKTYTIENKQGKSLAEFCFRPADTNIISRYKAVSTEEDPDIQKYEKQVIEQMNYLVNADAGNAFFGIMGPFSPMPDGTLFYETCLDAVCNVINQELDVRLEKMQKRTGKYTKKYYKPKRRKKSYHGR